MRFSKLCYFVVSCNLVKNTVGTLGLALNLNASKTLSFNQCPSKRANTAFFSTFRPENLSSKMPGSCAFTPKSHSDVRPRHVGEPGTKTFAVEFVDSTGTKVSPWHHLPMSPQKDHVTMVVEIPRNTRPKMEIKTDLEHNPIKQDLFDNGDLRDLDCPMYWNYGAVPQTWEAPVPYDHKYREGDKTLTLSLVGDNDPLDVLDVGRTTRKVGDVVTMKPVGALALIDQDELDWKVFAVGTDDPHYNDINELADVDLFYPGTTTGAKEFFRWYKSPRGKPLNKFLPEKTMVGRKETLEILEETHKQYKQLLEGKVDPGKLWTSK